jgi:hypothetical protein
MRIMAQSRHYIGSISIVPYIGSISNAACNSLRAC